jgi:ribose transport system substrate-binding protein
MRVRPTRAAVIVSLAAMLVLGACGDDDNTAPATTAAGGAASTAAGGGGGATTAAGGAATTAGGGAATTAGGGAATTAGGGAATTAGGGAATTAAGGTDEVSKAAAKVEPYLKEQTKITITQPLPKAPAKGTKLGWLEGNFESITVITPGFEKAAKALGWDLVKFSYDPGNPPTANSAMQQAVQAGVNYIAITGIDSQVFGEALASAKAANIPVVEMDIAAEKDAASKGILACVACDAMVTQWGQLMSDWIIADSGGNANVVYVNIPEFTSLSAEQQAVKDTFKNDCSKCKVDVLNSTIASFGAGTIAQEITSYIQSHPDVNYIYFGFGQMARGARDSMDAGGIGKNVKIVTADPDKVNAQNIIDGKESAGILLPVEGHAWYAVDAMTRHSTGADVNTTIDAPMPTQIWTKDNIVKPAQIWNGPTGYEDQFKTLWQVG